MRRTFFLQSSASAAAVLAMRGSAYAGAAAPQFAFTAGDWTTLHHRLFEQSKVAGVPDAREFVPGMNARVRADDAAIAGDDRAPWDAALAVYRRRYVSALDGNFGDADSATIRADAHSASAVTGVPSDVADALRATIGIQRRLFGASDARLAAGYEERARTGLVRYGDALRIALPRIFGAAYPAGTYDVYVVPYTDPFGAYSGYDAQTRRICVSSTIFQQNPVATAAETLFHEASHAIVTPDDCAVSRAIAAAAKARSHQVPPSLWHALMFFTVGTLVTRLAAARGERYEPGSLGVLERAFPRDLAAMRAGWTPWIDGHGTLAGATDRVIAAMPSDGSER